MGKKNLQICEVTAFGESAESHEHSAKKCSDNISHCFQEVLRPLPSICEYRMRTLVNPKGGSDLASHTARKSQNWDK